MADPDNVNAETDPDNVNEETDPDNVNEETDQDNVNEETDPDNVNEEETIPMIVAIIDFLRDELDMRNDLDPEDRDCHEMAIQCLEMAYGLEGIQIRPNRPLRDIFNQVTNPVSVKDKLQADAYKIEGNNYISRKMYAEAEAEYTKAIELDKWNSIYYCNRGGARIGQQRYFDGIADCRQALTLNPDYAKAHQRMGQAYALMNRHREAVQCFRQAVQLEPQNEQYRYNLRVAENEASRLDPNQFIAGLLGSLFGLGPQNIFGSSSRSSPTSFVIISERRIPSSDDFPENPEISENNPTTDTDTQASENSINSSSQNTNNIFGFPDRDEEELWGQHSPLQNQNYLNSHNPNEILIEIPLAFGVGTQRSMQSSPSQDGSDLQKTKTEGPKSTEDISDENTHTHTENETEPNDSENAPTVLNDDFTKKSDEKNQQEDENSK